MKLNRVLLINWLYYTKELLTFDQITLLSGKTGHGKSAFIDALQIVVLGETRDNNFNKSSGNTKTDRKLVDYLKGRNDEGNFKRKGVFSSHICLEFVDDNQQRFCFGIMFDCDGTTNEKNYRYYYIQDEIPKHEFILNNKVMTIDQTSRYIKELQRSNSLNKSKVFLTNTEYKRSFTTRLGIRNFNFYDVFKKAVSYKPLENIPDFIVKYICSETKEIDLGKLSESMETYKNLVQELKLAQEKRILMDQIYEATEEFKAMNEIYGREVIHMEVSKYFSFSKKLLDSRVEYHDKSEELKKIEEQIKEKKYEKEKKDELLSELRASQMPSETLKAEIKQIQKEISEKKSYINNFKIVYHRAIENVKKDIDNIIDEIDEDEIEKRLSSINLGQLSHELQKTKNMIDSESGSFNEELFERLATLQKKTNFYISDLTRDKKTISEKIKNLEEEIQQLQHGKKVYPSMLLNLKNAVKSEMIRIYNKNVDVNIFADCFDVTDPIWKNAIEAYLHKQKMNLIVDPEYFRDAYKIFKSVCKARNYYGYSLVDIERIRLKEKSQKISLYHKIKTDDERADKYVRFLLDRVVCCEDDKNIRDHFTSMTSDCTLYTSYAVSQLSSDLYRTPFIGTDSIEIQLQQALIEKKIQEREYSRIDEEINTLQISGLSELLNNKYKIEDYHSKLEFVALKNQELSRKQESLSLSEIEIMMEQEKEKNKVLAKIKEYEKAIDELNKKTGRIEDKCEDLIKAINNNSILAENQEQLLIDKNINQENYIFDVLKDYDKEVAASIKLQSECQMTMKINVDKVRLLKIQYNNQFNMSLNTTIENEDYIKEISRYSDAKIMEYISKVNQAHSEAKQCFENQFFATLKRKIDNVTRELKQLNRTIKLQRFGDSQYKFVATPNLEYKEYYDIIMAEDLNGRNLLNSEIYASNKDLIDRLFDNVAQLNQIAQKDYETKGKEIEKYTHFTTYLDFDILENENSLSKTISSKSGGETQTPFYIAILASLLNLYDSSKDCLRLVIFDEAFDKMDSERIEKSIKLLKDSGFQAIIATPTDKVPHIAPLSNDTYVATTEIIKGFKSSSLNRWTKGMELEYDE